MKKPCDAKNAKHGFFGFLVSKRFYVKSRKLLVYIEKFKYSTIDHPFGFTVGYWFAEYRLAMDDYPIGGATGVYSLWLAGLGHQVNYDSGA